MASFSLSQPLRRLVRAACPLIVAAFFWPNPALSQAYPDRSVRMIVSFPPGGGTDVLARLVAQKLGERWGHQVIVDNRGGGGGIIGTLAAARAAPDGHTLYFASSDHMILGPNLFSTLPYDTEKDFVPIVPVAKQNLVLVVHPKVPVNSVQEFIELARDQPGTLNYASAGIGSSMHLTGELFQSLTNVELTHIPYTGSGPAFQDLLAGDQVGASFAAVAPIVPHVQAGKVRPLAVTALERLPALPDVPTMEEEGVRDFEVDFWFALFAPAGTPAAIVGEVNRQVNEILLMPDMLERIAATGAIPTGGTTQELAARIGPELQRWGSIIEAAGIERRSY